MNTPVGDFQSDALVGTLVGSAFKLCHRLRIFKIEILDKNNKNETGSQSISERCFDSEHFWVTGPNGSLTQKFRKVLENIEINSQKKTSKSREVHLLFARCSGNVQRKRNNSIWNLNFGRFRSREIRDQHRWRYHSEKYSEQPPEQSDSVNIWPERLIETTALYREL